MQDSLGQKLDVHQVAKLREEQEKQQAKENRKTSKIETSEFVKTIKSQVKSER